MITLLKILSYNIMLTSLAGASFSRHVVVKRSCMMSIKCFSYQHGIQWLSDDDNFLDRVNVESRSRSRVTVCGKQLRYGTYDDCYGTEPLKDR